MTSKLRLALVLGLLGVLASCTVGEDPEPFDDVEAGVTVLEGPALADELARSPVRLATADFVRLGVIFDAQAPTSLEIATSLDGATWSAWRTPVVHHTEQESVAGYVGQLELPTGETARYYKLRGQATFLRMEEMVFRQSEHIEDVDDAPSQNRAAPAVTPGVLSRSEWGARSAKCSAGLGKVYRMAIHHTESPTVDKLSVPARLRQIQSYHMDVKGWCDIGYHFLVSRDGRVWQGRPVAQLGTHAGGANTGNIGIAVIGSHDSTPVTTTQINAIADVVRFHADAAGIAINRTTIKGHREYKSTSCPGDALFKQLVTIVESAKGVQSAPPPDEPPPPPPPLLVRIVGTLYAGETSTTRIAGATIAIGTKTTTTDTAGMWELDVAPGNFTVTASKTGYVTRTLARSTVGAETWASFGLSKANSATGSAILQGVVYYGSNSMNRIPFAAISLSSGQTIVADGNGYYKLGSLPAGTVTISASATGYRLASVSRSLTSGVTEWGSVKLAP